MAVAGESLDVDFGYGQLVRQVVRVIDAARLGEPLVQGGLLPQHLGEIRVAVLAVARVQALSKCVHYADLETEAKAEQGQARERPVLVAFLLFCWGDFSCCEERGCIVRGWTEEGAVSGRVGWFFFRGTLRLAMFCDPCGAVERA